MSATGFFTVLLEGTLLKQASGNVPGDLEDDIWLDDFKGAFQPQLFYDSEIFLHTSQRQILSLPVVVW